MTDYRSPCRVRTCSLLISNLGWPWRKSLWSLVCQAFTDHNSKESPAETLSVLLSIIPRQQRLKKHFGIFVQCWKQMLYVSLDFLTLRPWLVFKSLKWLCEIFWFVYISESKHYMFIFLISKAITLCIYYANITSYQFLMRTFNCTMQQWTCI